MFFTALLVVGLTEFLLVGTTTLSLILVYMDIFFLSSVVTLDR